MLVQSSHFTLCLSWCFCDGSFLELLVVALRKCENMVTGSVRFVSLFFPTPCRHACCVMDVLLLSYVHACTRIPHLSKCWMILDNYFI